MGVNTKNIELALVNARRAIKRLWEENAPHMASEIVGTSVESEQMKARHKNITGNMITSIVAGEFVDGVLTSKQDHSEKPAVRGMLMKGEAFVGTTWDGGSSKFVGSVETSGRYAADENKQKLDGIQPRLPHSLVILRGTPYANGTDMQLDLMTDLMLYVKGFVKISPLK